MKDLRYWAQSFFGISRKEADGFIIMMALLVALLVYPLILTSSEGYSHQQLQSDQAKLDAWLAELKVEDAPKKNWKKDEATPLPDPSTLFAFDPNTATADDLVKLGLPKYLADRIVQYRAKGGKFRKKEDIQKIYGFPEALYALWEPFIELPKSSKAQGQTTKETEVAVAPIDPFEFDPNTATIQELQQLGIPAQVASRIEKYRTKGGKFRKNEDLQKMYGFPEDLYEKLVPYIKLNPTQENQTTSSQFEAKEIASFELNAATVEQLVQIPGIGDKRAASIIRFRDKLGGFHTKEQAREVYGLPPEVADLLLTHATIDTFSIRKININTATRDDLGQHPYISYTMAKLIISYREQHGSYQSYQDLMKIRAIKPEDLIKVKPYLGF